MRAFARLYTGGNFVVDLDNPGFLSLTLFFLSYFVAFVVDSMTSDCFERLLRFGDVVASQFFCIL